MQIFVVHGYQAAPGDHWFPWLQSVFPGPEDQVRVLELPSPHEPRRTEWEDQLHHIIGRPTGDTVIVAHSLGCITALRYLAALEPGWSLRGLILVAGFADPLPSLPLLDPFTADNDFVDRLEIPRCTVLGSDNDTVVAPALTARLAHRLGAALTIVPGGGHFSADDGFDSFPELQNELEKLRAAR